MLPVLIIAATREKYEKLASETVRLVPHLADHPFQHLTEMGGKGSTCAMIMVADDWESLPPGHLKAYAACLAGKYDREKHGPLDAAPPEGRLFRK